MVICDDPAFLFIHVPKAAGTSIAGAFAHLDLMRASKKHKDAEARAAWMESKGFSAGLLDLPIHTSAARVREVIGEDKFNALYRFAVVRNPWDMELSWYTYNAQTESAPHFKIVTQYADFNDYVRRHMAEHGRLLASGPQTKYVFDENGTQIVDQVLRFEDLANGFATVIKHLGLPGIELDQFNQSYHAPWTEAYALDTFEIVREFALLDCDAFGYARDATEYGVMS